MGLGRHGGGVAAARWLAQQGAVVTVTDTASAEDLQSSVAELSDEPITHWRLGGHNAADFDRAEIVVVNPAVRPGNALVSAALTHGAQVTTELELFLERFPGRAIGVTGSNGKSTTTAMIASILAADDRDVYLGGNIGHSLLAELPQMTVESWAVIEISSFQLTWLSDECRTPELAVLTNFAPNHLDWHGDIAAYAAAKLRMFRNLPAGGAAILRAVEQRSSHWKDVLPRASVIGPRPFDAIPSLRVPGQHNQENAAMAAAAASFVGCSPSSVERGLLQFKGLPHRLELVGEIADRRYFNDSMATTPESVMAALETFDRCWLLCGGYDKGLDMAPLAAAIARRARGAAFYGAIGPRLHALTEAARPQCPLFLAERLDEAFAWCVAKSQPNDVIALSPGCASYDQYVDYRQRGAHFQSLVHELSSSRVR